MKYLALCVLLASRSLAQSTFQPSDALLAPFLPACKDNSFCESGICLVNGPNVNNDTEYFFCQEPNNCDPALPRAVDGICNNVIQGRRLRGSTGHSQLVRIQPTFSNLQSPRVVSDVIGSFSPTVPNTFGASTLLVMFGQFIDHDITIIEMEAADSLIIPGSGLVPDMVFQPSEHIGEEPPFLRNDLTSYVDLSQVYGSDTVTAGLLRTGAPPGELLSRIGANGQEFLPLIQEMPPAADAVAALGFLPAAMAAGDIRSNEHLMLLSWHTLFMREHNRLARQFRQQNPNLADEAIFQEARRWNIAQYQNIVFREYFEAWHRVPLPAYNGYNPVETPDVDIWFSTASYRFGHSGVPDIVQRIDEAGNRVGLQLGEAFFRPSQLEMNGGIGSLFKGGANQCHERIDTYFQGGLRNALFNDIPGLSASPAMDLYSLNVARGRDHEIGSYPAARQFFGLPVPATFAEVTGDRPCVTNLLEQLYGVDQVAACDPFVCGLAEPADFGEMGALFYFSQQDHFRRFRDADRFYYENTIAAGNSQGPGFDAGDIAQIRATTVADIITRNTFLTADSNDQENFLEEAFVTDACCRSDGNPEGNNDQMCVPNGDSDQFTLVQNLAQCTATDAVRAGDAFFPGSPQCTCSCNCRVAREQAGLIGGPRRFGDLSEGGFAGVIVGVVVGLICMGVAAWILCKRRREAKELDYTQSDQLSIASGASHPAAFGARSVHSEAPSVNNYF